MAENLNSFEHESPLFLSLIDRDEDAARVAFYNEAEPLLRRHRLALSLPEEDRKDMIQEVILHFIYPNFEVLRRYKNRGKPFIKWFWTVATNRMLDYIRAWRLRVNRHPDTEHENEGDSAIKEFIRKSGGTGNPWWPKIMEYITECFKQMNPKCRLLLRLASEGNSPKEIAGLMGEFGMTNVQVGNDLRYCRRRMKECLSERGVDLREILGAS